MAKKHLTEKQQIEICELYIDGETPLRLSLRYEVAQNTIWYVLERHGVPRKRALKKMIKQKAKEIVK